MADQEEMVEQLSVYCSQDSSDEAGFQKKIQSSITKAKTNNVLDPIRGDQGRYEVSPVLRLLFDADRIKALSESYHQLLHPDEVKDDNAPSSNPSTASAEEEL